jgi:hypothetical protein
VNVRAPRPGCPTSSVCRYETAQRCCVRTSIYTAYCHIYIFSRTVQRGVLTDDYARVS